METLMTAITVTAGMAFSLAVAILVEEWIFGKVFGLPLLFSTGATGLNQAVWRASAAHGGFMLWLKYLLMGGGIAMIALAASILAYDFYLEMKYRQALASAGAGPLPSVPQVRWRTSLALALLAWGPIVLSLGIVVVPSGMAGVRVSQTSGTLPGALYPGAHFVVPLAESIALFDTRDQLFTTGAIEDVGSAGSGEEHKITAAECAGKEGLTLGLSITVRYRLDPKRLDYIQSNMPQPVEKEIVPAVVASAWRELVPNYTVRDVFAAKREEVRKRASDVTTQKLVSGWNYCERSDAPGYPTATEYA